MRHALALLLLLILGLAACGGGDDVAERLRQENELAQARADAARQGRQSAELDQLKHQVREQEAATRRAERRADRRQASAAQPGATATAAPSTVEVEVEDAVPVRFQTGTDGGKDEPAAVCELSVSAVYCWTPNDGYTLRLTTAGVVRQRGDEVANRDRVPDYPYLGSGATSSAGAFSCTSGSDGLSCSNGRGNGWLLPRYVGLPSTY